MNNFKEIFDSSEYWFLRNLSFVNGNLVLIISAGKLSSQKMNLTISENVDIGPVKRIAPDSTSHHFRIEFELPVVFQRTNESYPWARSFEGSINGPVGVVDQLPPHIVDKSLLYYQINCLDDLIDVIAADHPKIVAISEADFDGQLSWCENYLKVKDDSN